MSDTGSRPLHIVVVGVNHRSAPLELRERLAFRREQLPGAFARLREESGLQEAAILSTCNRVEIYAGTPEPDTTVARLRCFLSEHGRLDGRGLRTELYSYAEPRSVQHLFAVASGLDSMVLGEAEILHQVKCAYELAKTHGSTGKVLNVLFQKALNAGKAVRSRTRIGHGCLSVGSVAVELATKILGDLSGYTVLLVGAGKVGELTVKRLAARGVTKLRVMNRSIERAQWLRRQYGMGVAVGLDALEAQLQEVDIVISSTACTEYLVTRGQLAALMPQRRHRPLCLIDLGVPRNLDPAIGELENVYLFNIDDLQGLVDHQHQQRQEAIAASQAILEHKVTRFLAWWQQEGRGCAPLSSELVGVR